MKAMASVHETKNRLSEFLRQAQEGPVLITSHGRPVGILVGVDEEGMDAVLMGPKSEHFWDELESLMTSASPKFRAMIAEARKPGPLIPLEEVIAETDALDAREKELGRELTRDEKRAFFSKLRAKKKSDSLEATEHAAKPAHKVAAKRKPAAAKTARRRPA